MGEERGLVHVYTGDGKGKTTCALGLSMRAWGAGRRVCFLQFLKKGPEYGESLAMARCPGIDHYQYGSGDFIAKGKVKEEDRRNARDGLRHAHEAASSGDYGLVVLDEAVMAVYFEVFSEEELLSLIDDKHPQTELVLTGRRASEGLLEAADYVTEMMPRKHPFERGIKARRGVEF